MMNRIIAICLLIAMTGSSLSRFFVYAGFEMNQKYIASVLCENRNRPEMHCNGKCYLMKKLKQAEEKEKRQEENNFKKGLHEIVAVYEKISFDPISSLLEKKKHQYIRFDLPDCSFEILHPPPAPTYLNLPV